MHPRYPGGAGWCADCSIVETVQVTESFLGELVDMGSLCILGSVTTDPFDAVVLAGDPKDVGFVFLSGKRKEKG